MSPLLGKNHKTNHILRIRQMLKHWRVNFEKEKSSRSSSVVAPVDVPSGHVAICVGSSRRRFIIRATHLNHPEFQRLLVEAEEEYGFSFSGPLTIPCEESVFEEILRVVEEGSESVKPFGLFALEDFERCCHVDVKNANLKPIGESRPLLG